MTKKQDDGMPTTFPDKWLKILKDLPEFKETADAASEADLKKIIITSEGNIYDIEQAKENDQKLNGAKEVAKDLSAPYRDAIKCQRAKIAYSLFLLEGKGVELGDKETD
jgi:hypothetical protein